MITLFCIPVVIISITAVTERDYNGVFNYRKTIKEMWPLFCALLFGSIWIDCVLTFFGYYNKQF